MATPQAEVEREYVVSASSSGPHGSGAGAVLVWDPQSGVQVRQFKPNQSGPSCAWVSERVPRVVCVCVRSNDGWWRRAGLHGVKTTTTRFGAPHVEYVVACQVNKPTLHCWDFGKVRPTPSPAPLAVLCC